MQNLAWKVFCLDWKLSLGKSDILYPYRMAAKNVEKNLQKSCMYNSRIVEQTISVFNGLFQRYLDWAEIEV